MDDTIRLSLETLKINKQAIVFVASRSSAEKTAEDIAKLVSGNFPELNELSNNISKVINPSTKQCNRLSKCISKGIAFHHAGLASKQKELIEDRFKDGTIKIICATPTLCLSGDTLIWQQGKEIPVRDFKCTKLFGLTDKNKISLINPKEVIKNKNYHKLVEITNVSGNSIKLTKNHKILIKRNGVEKLINANECEIKDKIATIGKLDFENIITPKISSFVVDNEFQIFDRELTHDDFYFIGSMIGDGYSGAEFNNENIIYKGSPNFTSGDKESINLIESIGHAFDTFSKQIKRDGSTSLVISKKKWFREFLCRAGVDIGINKFISPLLVQSEKSKLASLISGYFDADGYVQKGKEIGLSSISKQLIKDLQKSLIRFGIVSRVRKRPGKIVRITKKTYQSKPQYEIIISNKRCINLFNKYIKFRLRRKQIELEKLVTKQIHILYSSCKRCDYKIYSDLFSGRSIQQKIWGSKKRSVIRLLGKFEELGSREIKLKLGFEPKHKSGRRLNHHYELISKRKIGGKSNTEWFWSLNQIGKWINRNILIIKEEINNFIELNNCPICGESLIKVQKKKWRDSDFDGDIYWDYIRTIKEVDIETEVYDIVLPDKPKNDHMFVANGFIVHNSAGLSLPVFRVIIKTLKRFSGKWGMDWIPVLEYLQMAGRAGRPEYEKFGEAIVIARDEKNRSEIHEKYICGEAEDIYSKLAVEPVLRIYLLSLISSGIIKNEKEMREFFKETFWAAQFDDYQELGSIMDKMLNLLDEWGFVKKINLDEEVKNPYDELKQENTSDFLAANTLLQKIKDKITKQDANIMLKPTLIGKRISQLYLDPLTAKHLIDCIKNVKEKSKEVKIGQFSYLQMVSNTIEMRPLPNVRVKEKELINQKLLENQDELLIKGPDIYELDYPDFFKSIKTTLFFEEWINEKSENFLLDKYNIRPGEIRVKLENANWLLYASYELAEIIGERDVGKELRKLQTRVKYGVKEEIMPLLKFKGIGRSRARKLYNNGIKNTTDIKRIDIINLTQLIGEKLAINVKKQVGIEIKEVPKSKKTGQLSINKFF